MAPEKLSQSFSEKYSQLIRRNAIWPTLLTAIILLLMFYQPLILGESDNSPLFIPLAQFAHPDLLPIWDIHQSGGMPVWGDPYGVARLNVIDSALYSLLSPLSGIVPNIRVFYLLLNLLVLCGGMFAFARRNKLSPPAAAFASLVILFIPQYVLGVLGGVWLDILALTLLPVILLFMQNLIERRSLFWFSLAALFYAWQLLRAAATVTIITTVFIFLLYLVFALSRKEGASAKSLANSGLLMLLAIVTGFLAASYVYAPFFEYVRFAHIKTSLQLISLQDFILFFLPSYNGGMVQSSARFAFYVGVGVLLLAGYGVLLRRRAKTVIIAGGVILCLLAAWLGRPYEAGLAAPFLLVFLAAIGLDAIVAHQYQLPALRRSLDVYMILSFSFFAVMLTVLLLNKAAFMHHILQQIPLLTIPLQQRFYKTALSEGVVIFSFVVATLVIVWAGLRGKIGAGFFSLIMLLLVTIDLLLINYKIDFPAPPKEAATVEQLTMLKEDATLYRVFSTLNIPLPEYQTLSESDQMPLERMHEFYMESGFNEPDVRGMRNPFFSKYARLVSRFGEIVEEPIPVQYIDPERLNFDRAMLDMLNVKYILCNSPIYDPRYRSLSDSGLFIYENTSVLPRAFWVDSVAVLPGRRAIFDAMKSIDFSPTKVMYIETQPPFNVVGHDSNNITLDFYNGRKIELTADVQQPAALLLSEIYYPAGWRVLIDGIPAQLYRANYFLRAIFLQPGTHNISFQFAPLSFVIGWWTSLVFFGMLLLAALTSTVMSLRTSIRSKRPG